MYTMGVTAHTIPIKQGGSVKSLGVHYDMDSSGKRQRDISTQELNGLLAACRHRKATLDTIKAVLESIVVAKVAYRGVLSGWSSRVLGMADWGSRDCRMSFRRERRQ